MNRREIEAAKASYLALQSGLHVVETLEAKGTAPAKPAEQRQHAVMSM